VEVVEGFSGNGTSDTRSDGLASITNKIGDREDLGRAGLIDLKVPIVGELEGETRVVGSLYDNDISHEIRSQQQSQGLNHVGSLGDISG